MSRLKPPRRRVGRKLPPATYRKHLLAIRGDLSLCRDLLRWGDSRFIGKALSRLDAVIAATPRASCVKKRRRTQP
jgi:hypothetical protein